MTNCRGTVLDPVMHDLYRHLQDLEAEEKRGDMTDEEIEDRRLDYQLRRRDYATF